MNARVRTAARTKAAKPPRPRFQGWLSSDADEVERRRQRALDGGITIEALEPEYACFGSFAARSRSGERYVVEVRSFDDHLNSCDCPDYAINGLGTCKHIEAVLHRLRRGRGYRAAAERGNPRVEVCLDRVAGRVRIQGPAKAGRVQELLGPFFASDGTLLGDPLAALPAIERSVARAPAPIRTKIRLSRHLEPWLDRLRHEQAQRAARHDYEADIAAGKQSPQVLRVPLYPYQQEGMLHLAFTGRALLADEMGLGKTIQAIAACELLRRLHGIARVLVVCPASLKAEWEEQIARFTGLTSLVVQGPRALRLKQYRQPAFFYLTNYEQVRPDRRGLNEVLAPDVIILDEAQRIKNWQTQTAEAVKRLASRYAFVLTGTPIENRIDEVYSIVQFLDPHLFGPLFRFNRDFYELDERGRPVGYKNLDALHRRLRPVMLRRLKEEVEDQLPGRTVNTYFVAMGEEQAARYEEYSTRVARLLAVAKRRPLTPEEMDRLQQWLACMRMLCDTPYILDADCRVSPKLDELQNLLPELLEGEDAKLIIFSEWERMLELVRDLAEGLGVDFAWHTGSTPQQKRRKEIRRFKDDSACRLFLSTDAGSVGLNLQAANVVINLDLPWNPARLEQRIARAWRKHQKRSVQVINLVTEHSIEHRMVGLLEQKRTLAEGVVDGRGELREMRLPSGRAAFMERLQGLLGEPAQPAAGHPPAASAEARPEERLRQEALARWPERLDLLELHRAQGERPAVVAVLDRADEEAREALAQTVEEHLGGQSPALEVLDRATFETIQRLIAAGVLSLGSGVETLHRSRTLRQSQPDARAQRVGAARKSFEAVPRKQRMAEVLAAGGFPHEALTPLAEALQAAFRSLLHLHGVDGADPPTLALLESKLIGPGILPADLRSVWVQLREDAGALDAEQAAALVQAGQRLLQRASEAFEAACLKG